MSFAGVMRREAGMALVELPVVEQRYRAVLEAAAGVPVTEVAARYEVSRQSVHAWIGRYAEGGLGALADRPKRPDTCPHQVSAEIEAVVCELRREHPRWGPLRLVQELARAGVSPVPSRMSAYRVLVRHGLVGPVPAGGARTSTGGGSGRHRWRCGSSTSWAGRSCPAGPRRRLSPAWMIIPGTA
jgi:transposase